MAAQLSTKLTLDGTQHNNALRDATKELSKYKREVNAADKELKQLKAQSQTAIGSIRAFASSLKSGNIDGMLISGTSALKMFSRSMGALAGIGAGVSIGSWLKDAVDKGLELAKTGEGIRLAFDRLNKPGLLENLRKETHNTVTDIELMKQAVKFNDFNLDIEQMGTLLAFAQQKAKDTGQSVDYMVDSIVTGLGRQSLQILDNLGISAAEVKAQMKGGGDMTKAVAEIIRKKMDEAGSYVETAADRAKQQETELQNAYEELGRTFQPLADAAGSAFTSMQVGIINTINALRPLIDMLSQAGRARQQFENFGGNDKVNRMAARVGQGKTRGQQQIYSKQLDVFDKRIAELQEQIDNGGKKKSAGSGQSRDVKWLQSRLDAVKKMKDSYIAAVDSMKKKTDTLKPVKVDDVKTKTKGGSKKAEEVFEKGSVGAVEKEIENLQKKFKHATTDSMRSVLKSQIDELTKLKEALLNPANAALPSIPEEYKQLTNSIHKVIEAYDAGAVGSQKANELIKSFNDKIESIGLKPVKVHLDTEVIKQAKELTDNIAEVIRSYDLGAVGYEKANELIKGINDQMKSIGLRPVDVKIDSPLVKDAKQLAESVSRVMTEFDLGAISSEKARELVDGINAELESKGLRPLYVNIDSDAVHQARDLIQQINDIVEQHDLGAIGTKKARELINSINKEIKSLGLEPVKVDIETKGLKRIKDIASDIDSIGSGFRGIDDAKDKIEGLVESFSNGASAWDVFMGAIEAGQSVLGALTGVMETVNTLQSLMGTTAVEAAEQSATASATEAAAATTATTAKSGEAIASATASGAKMPFPMNLVAIAMGVAAVIAALGMIMGFANGGVIGGNSPTGDKLLARVNSGEMILNGRQQNNLFNAIDSGRIGAGGLVGRVRFEIDGRKLVGVLKNENDKMGKVR